MPYFIRVMFMHHDRLKAIRQHLQSAFFGNVKRVSASFSFNGAGGDFLNNNIRTKYDCDPLGLFIKILLKSCETKVDHNSMKIFVKVLWVIWAGIAFVWV